MIRTEVVKDGWVKETSKANESKRKKDKLEQSKMK